MLYTLKEYFVDGYQYILHNINIFLYFGCTYCDISAFTVGSTNFLSVVLLCIFLLYLVCNHVVFSWQLRKVINILQFFTMCIS